MSSVASGKRGAQVLNEALHGIFRERDDVVLFGEDVLDPYGGAFKVTAGLSDAYPDRVLTTPISDRRLLFIEHAGLGRCVSGDSRRLYAAAITRAIRRARCTQRGVPPA